MFDPLNPTDPVTAGLHAAMDEAHEAIEETPRAAVSVDFIGDMSAKAKRYDQLKVAVREWHAELVSILRDISEGTGIDTITARLTGVVVDLAKHKEEI